MRIILFVCAGEVVKFFYLPDRLQPPSESGYTVYLDQVNLHLHMLNMAINILQSKFFMMMLSSSIQIHVHQ